MKKHTDHPSGISSGETILEMIVRRCEPREILETICVHFGDAREHRAEKHEQNGDEKREIAFLILDAGSWWIAARGDLSARSGRALARIVPDDLSRLLFQQSSECGGAVFNDGWARHLYSGAGEMLGVLVCFGSGPVEPSACYAKVIDHACNLATLAIEQRNLRDELIWQGDHDSVTGLYTPTFFERMLAWHVQQETSPAALLHINLDRFRLVNDVLGHSLGNRILRFVGRRFSACLEPHDLIARAGGDEFAILLKNNQPDRAAATADRLLRTLAEPLSIDEHQVFVSASIGISRAEVCPGPSVGSGQGLQREAYVALYHAKRNGKAGWARFDATMAATPPERLEMEKCLRSALSAGEMMLYYQPQVDLASGFVVGAEALLRWNPPGLGIISPGTFIPILEETGMIVPFGRWVLHEACRRGKQWIDSTGLPLRIGVNVSALQLRHPDFVLDVEAALAESGYPAELLELELTESIFVGDFQPARRILHKLRELDVTLALDDFGTGQSSLSYLQELPFQRLKVDQSFVRSIHSAERCPPVIESILSMARDLGMTTIAEGIEHPHQAEVLRNLGCDEGQGYLFSYPLPPGEFLDAWIGHAGENFGPIAGVCPDQKEVGNSR